MSEHQPVWKKSDYSYKNCSASDNEIHRIAASPKQMKTQIAKISYTSTLRTPTKNKKPVRKKYSKEREDDSTEPESRKDMKSIQLETNKKITNDNTGFDFVKMKEERDQEFKNLNSYLTEIINKKSPDKSKLTENNKIGNEAESSTNKHDKMFSRSKTENDFIPSTASERRSKTRVGSIERAKSSHLPDTKSHELLSLVSQKSYDVERARKFLQDQKRKRRFKQGFTAVKAKDESNILDKEQIKKRLEELRKNSRAIVAKNVNKKKNVHVKPQSNQNIALGEKKAKQKVDPDLSKEIYFAENNCGDILKGIKVDSELKTKKDVTPATCFSNINEKVTKNEETGGSKSNNNNITITQEHMEENAKLKLPEKRIGLLRKLETKDLSFNAIREFNFDKENIVLEMMAPKLSQSVPMVPKTTSNDINNGKDADDIPMEFTYRKPATVTLQNTQTNQFKNTKLLNGNEVDGIRKDCEKVHSKYGPNTNNNTVNDLPYWLKPSAVQIYPYNFIMAVRRKLEALADVRSTSQIDIKSQQNVSTDETFLPRYDTFKNPKHKKPYAGESKHLDKSKTTFKIDVDRKGYTNCNNSNIQYLSEINSNLSSISVQSSKNPPKASSKKSNSDVLSHSKTKASAQASDDDTTISSSIFNSPKRYIRQKDAIGKGKIEEVQGTISPLSLERVENLTIMSSKKLRRAIATKHVNINRGDSQVSCTVEKDLYHNKNTTNEIDFNKFLNDFNRSLSQVIEVNDRLKTTINKSQEICGTIQTEKSNPSEVDQYTTDFEKCSSPRASNCSSDIQNEIELRNAHVETCYERENYELEYEDKQTFKHSKYCIKSKEQNIDSHQKLHTQLRKIDKSKDKSISARKYWLNKICNETSEICSCSEKEKILKQEKCERAKNLTESLISTNTSAENGYEIAFNIAENIRSKTENEYMKNIDSLETCLSERKTSLTHMKHEDKPYKQHLFTKNKTSSHKILEMFDHSNLEISLGSTSNDSLSDLTCSYSNVGMYEKLIRNETTKSEHLAALLKMREKALFDRTKGQIAWLEVQKERCKSNGLLLQIAAIKKKQRGILLKMEKEREELKRLLQSTTTTSSTESTSNRERKAIGSTSSKSDKSVTPLKTNSTICHRITQLSRDDKKPPTSQSCSVSSIHYKVKVDRPEPVVRANYSLETSRSLEELLEKRELDLQRRREHVERLMQWHLRLDQEEAEVLQMENKVLNYNTHKSQYKQLVIGKTKELHQDHASTVSLQNYNANVRVHRRLKEIKNSLKELKSISRSDTTAESNEGSEEEIVSDAIDCVRTSGAKLNKLWRRLTSQHNEKYEPDKHYQLSKEDLEDLYEAAKVAVLKDFSRNEGCLAADLLEKSIFSYDTNISPQQQKQPEEALVPSLKLSASPETSDKEGESWEDTSANSLPTDNYSPSTAAEKFHHIYERSSRSATLSCVTQSSSEANILLTKITSSMRSSAPDKISNAGLVRSLSDSILYSKNTVPQNKKHETLNEYKESEIESLSKQVLENNIPLAVPLIAYSETHESTKSTTENVYETAGLNCKNVCMEKETREIQPNILSSSHQNLDPIPNVINNNISSCTNLDTAQNYNNSSSSFTNLDSIKSQYLQDEDSINSKTFINQPNFFEIEESTNDNLISKSYKNDFESTCELKQIDCLLLPHFKSIVDTSLSEEKSDNPFSENVNIDRGEKYNLEYTPVSPSVSENPKDTQVLHSNSEILPVPSSSPIPEGNIRLQAQDANNGSTTSSSVHLMPDIINELEIRRCQQILIEPEKVKQFENSSTVIPYMYVREIPNKPPPPYVPPAHGSPMTTIFPSEERIREISYRRTHELYCELLKTDYINEIGEKLPTVMDENITNIYERIILDICREYLNEHSEVLKQGNPVNFHTQLAFFNPPNRLHCIQKSVYKEVRRCLAMDKPLKRRTPIYSVYGQRANHDHIGKIIIQEMYDEDDKWCNFHREENEVIDLIISEMFEKCLTSIAKEVLIEENGAVDFTYTNREDSCEKDVNLCSNEAESKQPNNSVDLRHDA